jgi:hypothetical protein
MATCAEYSKLLAEYREAATGYSTTVAALAVAQVSAEEYRRMMGYVDQARDRTERARIALQNHATQHHCYPPFDLQVSTNI